MTTSIEFERTIKIIKHVVPTNKIENILKQASPEERRRLNIVFDAFLENQGNSATTQLLNRVYNLEAVMLLSRAEQEILPISRFESLCRGFQNIFGSRISSAALCSKFFQVQDKLVKHPTNSLQNPQQPSAEVPEPLSLSPQQMIDSFQPQNIFNFVDDEIKILTNTIEKLKSDTQTQIQKTRDSKKKLEDLKKDLIIENSAQIESPLIFADFKTSVLLEISTDSYCADEISYCSLRNLCLNEKIKTKPGFFREAINELKKLVTETEKAIEKLEQKKSNIDKQELKNEIELTKKIKKEYENTIKKHSQKSNIENKQLEHTSVNIEIESKKRLLSLLIDFSKMLTRLNISTNSEENYKKSHTAILSNMKIENERLKNSQTSMIYKSTESFIEYIKSIELNEKRTLQHIKTSINEYIIKAKQDIKEKESEIENLQIKHKQLAVEIENLCRAAKDQSSDSSSAQLSSSLQRPPMNPNFQSGMAARQPSLQQQKSMKETLQEIATKIGKKDSNPTQSEMDPIFSAIRALPKETTKLIYGRAYERMKNKALQADSFPNQEHPFKDHKYNKASNIGERAFLEIGVGNSFIGTGNAQKQLLTNRERIQILEGVALC